MHIGGPLNKDWIKEIKNNQKNKIHSIAIDFLNNLSEFDNLEALLSLVDLSVIEQHNYLPISAPLDYLENVRTQIVECIVNVANEITSDAEEDPLIYDFFRKTNLKDGDTVINFNYDLGVDWGLYKTKLWNPYQGTENNRCGYGFGMLSILGAEDSEKAEFQKVQDSKVDYYKLHGSVNWRWVNDGFIELDWKCFSPQKIPTTSLGWTSKYPFVITPSFLKMLKEAALRMLWLSAQKSITEATEIYVVGYSFLEADILARQLLLYVNPDKIKKIIVIDPLSDACSETDKRGDIRSMLPLSNENKKIEIIIKTLKDYTKSLPENG